ncbi:MAG: DUF2974 domain-containing protein [Eubacteriales bacterium]|nr:DUF2974 domain-containing protein [Eubacteriales bacterium]
MADAIDYILWRGDLTFDKDPVNDLDICLCSQFVTPDLTGIVSEYVNEKTLSDVADEYFANNTMDRSTLGVLQSEYVLPAIRHASKCNRFKDIRLFGYINRIKTEEQEQFSAVNIMLKDNLLVVSFKGTDDTLIGWREDFDLSCYDEVPAQKDALSYLRLAATRNPKAKIIVTGHSKGGNLAIYSAAMIDEHIQKRIVRVVSFDGPGFRDGFLESEGYKRIKDRCCTIMSQYAIVGLLLNTPGEHKLVRSRVPGIWAHDIFNWEVLGKEFVAEEELSMISDIMMRSLRDTLCNLSDDERLEFNNAFFNALTKTGAKTLTDLENLDYIKTLTILQGLSKNKHIENFSRTLIKELLKYTSEEVKKERKNEQLRLKG